MLIAYLEPIGVIVDSRIFLALGFLELPQYMDFLEGLFLNEDFSSSESISQLKLCAFMIFSPLQVSKTKMKVSYELMIFNQE